MRENPKRQLGACMFVGCSVFWYNALVQHLSCFAYSRMIFWFWPSCSQVEIEFDMRASGDLGRPNSETRHIQTYQRHDMLMNEKKLMAKLS